MISAGVGLFGLVALGLVAAGPPPAAKAARACTEALPGDDEIPCGVFEAVLGTTDGFRLRGRMVFEEEDEWRPALATPLDDLTQDEIDEARVHLRLVRRDGSLVWESRSRADDEGWIDLRVDLRSGPDREAPPAGSYRLHVLHEGLLAADVGVRLLGTGFEGVVVRSDVDQTYLATAFHGASEKAKLLRQTASRKAALPEMPAVYGALRRGPSKARSAQRPLLFLSGSPRFFRRQLEGKMALDGVAQDGLVLKPMKGIARTRLRAGKVGGLARALEEQVGYKLHALLERRLELPRGAQELLMGDDSEADHAVYALYHRLLSGVLDAEGLATELKRLGVGKAWRNKIAALAPRAVAATPRSPAPVVGIFVRATPRPNDAIPVSDWDVAGLTVHHRGTGELVEALVERGFIAKAEGARISGRLR